MELARDQATPAARQAKEAEQRRDQAVVIPRRLLAARVRPSYSVYERRTPRALM